MKTAFATWHDVIDTTTGNVIGSIRAEWDAEPGNGANLLDADTWGDVPDAAMGLFTGNGAAGWDYNTARRAFRFIPDVDC